MRKTGSWMRQPDELILQTLDEEGWMTPKLMSEKPEFDGFSSGHIRERSQVLAQAGLVHFVHNDMVELTGQGQRYLSGDLDADLVDPNMREGHEIPVWSGRLFW